MAGGVGEAACQWSLVAGCQGVRAWGVCYGKAQEGRHTPGCQSDSQALREMVGFSEGSRAVIGD